VLWPTVHSVTLNLANKFSQCTFSVVEHYDLFSDLIILHQAWSLRSYDIPHRPHRQRHCCRKSSTLPHRPDINLCAAYHAIRDESTIQSTRPLQICLEQPTPSLQNCHAHSLKTAKHFSKLTTYLASFSVTYLATSQKLAKFSITEDTAGLDLGHGMAKLQSNRNWMVLVTTTALTAQLSAYCYNTEVPHSPPVTSHIASSATSPADGTKLDIDWSLGGVAGMRSTTPNTRWSQRNGSFVSSLPGAALVIGRFNCTLQNTRRMHASQTYKLTWCTHKFT